MKTSEMRFLSVILKRDLDQDLLAYSVKSSPSPKPIMHCGGSRYEVVEVKLGFPAILYPRKRSSGIIPIHSVASPTSLFF